MWFNDASNEPFKVADSVSAITVNDLVCESVEVKDVIDDYILPCSTRIKELAMTGLRYQVTP